MPQPGSDPRETGRSFIRRIGELVDQFARLDMSDPAVRAAASELDAIEPILRQARTHLEDNATATD
jgi:hypothetical protein